MSTGEYHSSDDVKISLGMAPFSAMSKNVSNFAKSLTIADDAIYGSMGATDDMSNVVNMIGCAGNNNGGWSIGGNSWIGGGACNGCGLLNGACMCNNLGGLNGTFIGTSFNWGNTGLIVKGKSKADILGDFFGQEVHALVILDEADGGARFIPFMDKFDMIWLQDSLNSWAAYDRDEFLKWVQSDQTMFVSPKLKKEEVLKRLAKPSKHDTVKQ